MGEQSVVSESENARESPEEESKTKGNFTSLVEQKSSIEAAIIDNGAESLPNSRTTSASGKIEGDSSVHEIGASEVVGNVEEKPENHPKTDFYTTAAGSSVFEARILGVMTDGSVQELNDDRCHHINGFEALILRNEKFSAWVSIELKKIK